MTDHRPLPDLFREPARRHPFWLRVLFLAAAVLCFAAGVVGWLIPVVTGLPFYAAGLVFLALAAGRVRRGSSGFGRRLAEGHGRADTAQDPELPRPVARRVAASPHPYSGRSHLG